MPHRKKLTSAAPSFLHARPAARPKIGTMRPSSKPGERHLRGRGTLGRGELFDRLDHSLLASIASMNTRDPREKSFTPKLDVLATLPVR